MLNISCVVICLKNRTFAVSQTSCLLTTYWGFKLWFAWKIVLLQYHKHHKNRRLDIIRSCDLLEKSYFCSITNITTSQTANFMGVVICLKNRTFAVSQTSSWVVNSVLLLLWFAWKIVLLQYHKHQYKKLPQPVTCCDLLEKSYFCSITNILLWSLSPLIDVVICLKNRTFAVSQTSNSRNARADLALWFAWKIVLLQYHKHLAWEGGFVNDRCDLLEKSYFCSITNILNWR